MLKLKFDFLLYLSILSLLRFAFVKSTCVLKYPCDIEIAPTYTKYFGRYAVDLPYSSSGITLKTGETIHAKCFTGFSSIVKSRIPLNHYYDSYDTINIENQTYIELKCGINDMYLVNNNKVLQDNLLQCQKLNWSIYEDNKTQNWCKTDTGLASLLLATKSNSAYHILAQICFNLNDWSLKTITYNITAPFEDLDMLRDLVKTKLHSTDLVGENLWNFKSTNSFDLSKENLQLQLEEMIQRNFWLHLANYELSSIVQGKSYKNYFKEYSNILNTIWWPNLRLGNWKRFMDTLENYAYNNSFQLYVGTSGVVSKPAENLADLSTDLTVKFGFKRKPVPAYIWTYLISTDKTNKDFIIVGYNSPYAEFFSRKEIVFCPDICDEIPWLNGISKSFKFSIAGIMFCCTPESIQQTNLLNGFPMEISNSRMEGNGPENETLIEYSTINQFTTSTEQTAMPNTKVHLPPLVYNVIRSEESNNNDFEERNFSDEEKDFHEEILDDGY